MGQTVAFGASSEQVIAAITAVLAQHEYRVARSFDLRSVPTYSAADCPCPHHGTEQCTCQYVVLLVYRPAAGLLEAPRVLTVHTYEQTTLVTLHSESAGEDEGRGMVAALFEAALPFAPGEQRATCCSPGRA
jgi:hypothetical protein